MATAATAEPLLTDLRKIFGERLRSLVTYGEPDANQPTNSLVLVASLGADDLDACAATAHRWHRAGLATPLFLPEQEFRRSLDAFPLEYSEIQRAHALVYGGDPFEGLSIAPEDLRRACETQVKSHLLHLREGYIEAAGHPERIADLVEASAAGFAALLRNVARLYGVNLSDRSAATHEGARLAALPEDVVAAVLSLEHSHGVASTDPARLFPRLLAAVEQLAAWIDSWRP
jgi:hypothetical protein